MTDWREFFANEKLQTILSGAVGGLVRWLTLRDDLKSGVISVVVGGACALYISPLAFPLIDPFLKVLIEDPLQRTTFGGFIIGLGGITITGFILDLISRRTKENDKP